MRLRRILEKLASSKIALLVTVFTWTFVCVQLLEYTTVEKKYTKETFISAAKSHARTYFNNTVNVSEILHRNATTEPPPTPPPKPTLKQFVAGEPVHVLILAYQRTGSTFFGNIFAQNPDAFYFYEPLDGVFTYLYGTSPGWAVPIEISHDSQGKLRTIPEAEQHAMAETLMGMYTCQFSSLPTEVMGHTFMSSKFKKEQPHLEGYYNCVGKHNIAECKITNVCPSRLGDQQQVQKRCKVELERRRKPMSLDWDIALNKQATVLNRTRLEAEAAYIGANGSRRVLLSVNVTSKTIHPRPPIKRPPIKRPQPKAPAVTLPINSTEAEDELNEYMQCVKRVQISVDGCYSKIAPLCERRHLHAIKTVRMDMDSVEALLEHLPNLRVIHLIRDPRGVALSRKGLEWSSGKTARKDMIKAAAMFCEVATKDIRKRNELEARYPGAFMQVIYEDFTESPVQIASDMYNFLNMTLPPSVEKFLKKKTQTNSNSKWQDKLTFHQAYDIHTQCMKLFTLVNEPRWLTMG